VDRPSWLTVVIILNDPLIGQLTVLVGIIWRQLIVNWPAQARWPRRPNCGRWRPDSWPSLTDRTRTQPRQPIDGNCWLKAIDWWPRRIGRWTQLLVLTDPVIDGIVIVWCGGPVLLKILLVTQLTSPDGLTQLLMTVVIVIIGIGGEPRTKLTQAQVEYCWLASCYYCLTLVTLLLLAQWRQTHWTPVAQPSWTAQWHWPNYCGDPDYWMTQPRPSCDPAGHLLIVTDWPIFMTDPWPWRLAPVDYLTPLLFDWPQWPQAPHCDSDWPIGLLDPVIVVLVVVIIDGNWLNDGQLLLANC